MIITLPISRLIEAQETMGLYYIVIVIRGFAFTRIIIYHFFIYNIIIINSVIYNIVIKNPAKKV